MPSARISPSPSRQPGSQGPGPTSHRNVYFKGINTKCQSQHTLAAAIPRLRALGPDVSVLPSFQWMERGHPGRWGWGWEPQQGARVSRGGSWPEGVQQALPRLAVSPSPLRSHLEGAEGKAASLFRPSCLGGSGPNIPTHKAPTAPFLSSRLCPALAPAPVPSTPVPSFRPSVPRSLTAVATVAVSGYPGLGSSWVGGPHPQRSFPCSKSPHLQPLCLTD